MKNSRDLPTYRQLIDYLYSYPGECDPSPYAHIDISWFQPNEQWTRNAKWVFHSLLNEQGENAFFDIARGMLTDLAPVVRLTVEYVGSFDGRPLGHEKLRHLMGVFNPGVTDYQTDQWEEFFSEIHYVLDGYVGNFMKSRNLHLNPEYETTSRHSYAHLLKYLIVCLRNRGVVVPVGSF